MKVALYSKDGKKKKDIELNSELFESRVNQRLLELVANAYAANLRRGTACTKTRKDNRGGGKKPWKQKGTGRARASSTRSPLWRGGGTVFGPKPRSYFVALPSTMRRSAMISALSKKAQDENLVVLENAKLDSAKTKEFYGVVKNLPLAAKRALCVVADLDDNLKRASRNVSYIVDVVKASDVNAYHILQREKLVLEEGALEILEKRLLVNKEKAAK